MDLFSFAYFTFSLLSNTTRYGLKYLFKRPLDPSEILSDNLGPNDLMLNYLINRT